MGFRYSDWETRSADVFGIGAAPQSGSFAVSSDVSRTDAGSTYGASPPGSYPWEDPAKRIITADRARTQTSSSHSSTREGQTFMDMSADPDTNSRQLARWARVGSSQFTTADRVLSGTYYDDFTFSMWLGRLFFSVGEYWLQDVYAQPGPTWSGSSKTLTQAEHLALWGDDFPPAGFELGWRQVDLEGCGVAVSSFLDYESNSPTPPTITRRKVTSATSSRTWWASDTIEAEPLVGSFTGSGTVALTGATGAMTDVVNGPHQRVSGVNSLLPGPVVDEFNLPYVIFPIGLNGGAQNSAYTEWLDNSSLWPTGVDPGVDTTGSYPPPDPPSTVYTGGPGADRWANVRLQTTWTFTIRMRWVTPTFGTPPLWQRQRIGVMDSSEQFSSGLLTPQSSPWQGGML